VSYPPAFRLCDHPYHPCFPCSLDVSCALCPCRHRAHGPCPCLGPYPCLYLCPYPCRHRAHGPCPYLCPFSSPASFPCPCPCRLCSFRAACLCRRSCAPPPASFSCRFGPSSVLCFGSSSCALFSSPSLCFSFRRPPPPPCSSSSSSSSSFSLSSLHRYLPP